MAKEGIRHGRLRHLQEFDRSGYDGDIGIGVATWKERDIERKSVQKKISSNTVNAAAWAVGIPNQIRGAFSIGHDIKVKLIKEVVHFEV
jgi:hypothetical protein